jgi:hypothetical protein
MNMSKAIALGIFFLAAPLSIAQAQMDQGTGETGRTQELVDQLKEVIRGAEQDRRLSPSVTRQLKDLVRRYDWPWRVSLLYDDFRDGDYAYDPRWIVKHGDFRVVRGAGLKSYFDPAASGTYRASDRKSDSPALEILSEILIGNRERAASETQTGPKSEAEIFTRVGISNAFALKLQLSSRDRNGRIEFGPFQGEDRRSGYRLAYESGRTPSLSLLRFGPYRSAVIEMVDQGIALDDGVPHTLEWRRSNDGEMVVLLDTREVMRTVDRAYDDPFDGFAVINKGGEFDMKQVSIFGTRR